MSEKHRNRFRKLIESAGGSVEDIFVTKPGVKVIMKTEVCEEARDVFEAMNIDTTRPDYEQAGEFASRITYMSYKDEPGQSSEEYNRKMVEEYGHLSVHSCHNVTFLLAGISLEASLELIAHTEASVARLTSSRTAAQDQPLFRVQGSFPRVQKGAIGAYLRDMTEVGQFMRNLDDKEGVNRLHPGSKATALTYTMKVKDFHKTFIGRLSEHGVELEVRELCEEMCRQLHELYPLVIKTPEEYYAMNNNAKYLMED